MACSTLANRSESCKEFVGGIRGIWLIPFLYDNIVTKDVNDLVTIIELVAGGAVPINANFWELKGLSTMETTTNSSRDNGNTNYETTLTLSFKPGGTTALLGETDNDLIDTLLKGRWQVIVWDRNDQFRLLGENEGCDADGGSISFGVQMNDARLNTITFKSMEKTPPALVTGSQPSDINGTVVTLLP